MTQGNELVALSIIHTKGTLDWAYSTLILASTAAAMDKKVEIFFSFYGIECLYKDTDKLKVSPLGNPAMIMKSPIGPKWFRGIDWNQTLPELVWTLPGMTKMATIGFKKTLEAQNQLPINELRSLCLELGVKFTVCSMAFDLLGFDASELIDEIEFAGAATYFATTSVSQSLFV